MDYESMTIDQLNAEVIRIEGIVRTNRSEQLTVHNVAERKRRMVPIFATPFDQTMKPNNFDAVDFLKSIPAAALEEIKKALGFKE